MSSRILFLYDELMTRSTQQNLRLPIHFLSYGYVRGRMYWCNDEKKRRYFIIPPSTQKHIKNVNDYVYGGIFVINDYEEYERSLYSFYNSSIAYLGKSIQEDLYIPEKIQITPIKFKTLQELEECRYTSLEPFEGLTMMANQENKKIQNSISHGRYYRRVSGFDVPNFLTMLMENN